MGVLPFKESCQMSEGLVVSKLWIRAGQSWQKMGGTIMMTQFKAFECSAVITLRSIAQTKESIDKFRTWVEAAGPIMDITVASLAFTARMFNHVIKLQNPICILPPNSDVRFGQRATNPRPTRLWHWHHENVFISTTVLPSTYRSLHKHSHSHTIQQSTIPTKLKNNNDHYCWHWICEVHLCLCLVFVNRKRLMRETRFKMRTGIIMGSSHTKRTKSLMIRCKDRRTILVSMEK
jgi:hypothetical protein